MVSLREIFDYFEDQRSLIDRGEKAVQAADIQSFRFEPKQEIQASVAASMRNRVYEVKVYFEDHKLKECTCECPKGQDRCHHMAAVLIYASKHISCTDQPCSWNVSKEPKEIKTSEELFGSSNKKLLKRKPNEDDKAFLVDSLKRIAPNCGLTWLLSEQPQEKSRSILVKTFDQIVKDSEFQDTLDKPSYLFDKMKVDSEMVQNIYEKTIGQRNNPLWGAFRKGRITSSQFGLVLKALSNNKIPQSLLKSLNGEYNLDSVKAVQWGITHEATAIYLFKCVKKLNLYMGGLFLHSSGLIGCSPDAVVEGNALLEVKCPFSKNTSDIIAEAYKKNWYVIPNVALDKAQHSVFGDISVYEFESSDMELNTRHPLGYRYYHQIQGMLYLMNKEFCNMLIWTPKMSVMFKICKDPTWIPNADKIVQFYKTIYVYYLLK